MQKREQRVMEKSPRRERGRGSGDAVVDHPVVFEINVLCGDWLGHEDPGEERNTVRAEMEM